MIRVFPTSWLSRPRPLRPNRSWEVVMKTPAGIHAIAEAEAEQENLDPMRFFMDTMRGVSGVNLAYKVIFCYRPLPHSHYVLSPFHFFKLTFYRLLFFKSFPTVSVTVQWRDHSHVIIDDVGYFRFRLSGGQRSNVSLFKVLIIGPQG